ncbi:MAG: FtsQ-type POTRA domain-containing protein [Verrucomicrobiae bacterium]|nr:FtsQ-type POTRA domain-containing protein [Verrucomicrobiae bacterium]NNJ87527.1 FtsQ-type POTRA domain-containing protein [Akkermansiaceae bacterium]
MSFFKTRKKTTRSRRNAGKGGDLQKLHIKVSSPRIVMFQVMNGIGKGVKYFIILALLGLICVGGYKGIQHLFLGNEKYRLQEVDLQTNGHLNHARVVELTGIDLNASIFAIDTDHVHSTLQNLPEVIACDVERRLPGTLKIKILERVPAVWIECESLGFPGRRNGGVLADKNGITFPCEGELWQAARDLPVIVVKTAKSDAFKHGSKVTHTDFLRALHLIKTFETANVREQWLPERVVLINDYSMKAVCNDGSYAIFGMYDHDRQLDDFISIREHSLRTNRIVKHINLIPKKNIPVKFVGDPILVKPKRPPLIVNPHDREIQSILNRN